VWCAPPFGSGGEPSGFMPSAARHRRESRLRSCRWSERTPRVRRRSRAMKGHCPVRLTGRRGERRWRESPRQEREDWVTTVRAALSTGPDNDRDVAQRCRITHRPKGATTSSDRPIGARDRDPLTREVGGRSPSGCTPPDRASRCAGDHPSDLIARAYRRFAQPCCGARACDGSLLLRS
jgi:hypothetical protein